jgi:hypothetical protein
VEIPRTDTMQSFREGNGQETDTEDEEYPPFDIQGEQDIGKEDTSHLADDDKRGGPTIVIPLMLLHTDPNEGLDEEGYVDFHLLNENAENEPNRSNAILGRKKVDGGVHSTGSNKVSRMIRNLNGANRYHIIAWLHRGIEGRWF